MDVYVVVDHFKAFWAWYVMGAVFVAPALYFTRSWSVPGILYAIEIAIYLAAMHGFIHCVVMLTRWFAENSSMRALREDGKPQDTPDWATPLLDFWHREAYDPNWVLYVECAFALVIVFLVWKFRPMRIHKPRKKRSFANERGKSMYNYKRGTGASGGRGGLPAGRGKG